jgi:hypothetical protein
MRLAFQLMEINELRDLLGFVSAEVDLAFLVDRTTESKTGIC